MADTDVGWMHAAGITAMLEAAVPYTVYTGEVTTRDEELEFPHLIAWPPPANRPTIAMAGYGGEARTVTQITAVGRDVREVITALDRATAALHRRRPSIAGRACSLIRVLEDVATPPQPSRDDTVSTPDRPVFFSFVQAELFSAPAPEEP